MWESKANFDCSWKSAVPVWGMEFFEVLPSTSSFIYNFYSRTCVLRTCNRATYLRCTYAPSLVINRWSAILLRIPAIYYQIFKGSCGWNLWVSWLFLGRERCRIFCGDDRSKIAKGVFFGLIKRSEMNDEVQAKERYLLPSTLPRFYVSHFAHPPNDE